MQTEIKSQYDAGAPGDLVTLPSFTSAAKVESCRSGGVIYPGDGVKLGGDGSDSTVVPMSTTDDASLLYGVAVRAHSNMPTMPNFGDGSNAYPVSANSNIGIDVDGTIYVAVKSGQTPKKGDLAAPTGRNATTNYMEWGVITTGQTAAKFDSGILPGGVAKLLVVEGALLGKQ